MSTKLIITIEVEEDVNRRVLNNILGAHDYDIHTFIKDKLSNSISWQNRTFGRHCETTINIIDTPKT